MVQARMFLLLLVLIFQPPTTTVAVLAPGDAFALRHLRYSLQVRNFYWPKAAAETACESWRGIQCDEQGQRVVGIHLSGLKRTLQGMVHPGFSIEPLGQLSSLRVFNASGFVVEYGFIPQWIDQVSNLQVLDLSFCEGIRGSIPDSIGRLYNLKVLSLAGNNLTGTLPDSLDGLKNLTSLDVSSNMLTGPIPFSITALDSLEIVNLSNNSLMGTPGTSFQNMGRLRHLDLSSNSFSGDFPLLPGVQNSTSLKLSLSGLNGGLTNPVSSLFKLEEIDLSHNLFSGSIPAFLSSLKSLTSLDLSFNNFSGSLPAGLSTLVALKHLDLSHNSLFGSLPTAIVPLLKKIPRLDISDNYLNGLFPSRLDTVSDSFQRNCLRNVARQRYKSVCKSFYASKGLTFSGDVGLLPTASPLVGITYPTPESVSKHRRKTRDAIAVAAGTLGSIAFIVVIVFVVVYLLERKQSHHSSQKTQSSQQKVRSSQVMESSPATATVAAAAAVAVAPPRSAMTMSTMISSINLSCIGESFTMSQLQRATWDFSPTNLIKRGHTGDLYRGILDGGLLVVVKRVDLTTMRRDLLVAELEVFSKASHTRLVPLLGHCLDSSEEHKYLVYKFMQHGDLSQALHRKIVPSPPKDIVLQSMDWITRLKICIGTAEALTYLHHECSPPLVHRDVKATSILLDDKFEVRLGSLSEARVQDGGSQPGLIMRLLRRSQTSEQQVQDSTVASCAYDVYCFGKVLLELVSGKLGLSYGAIDAGVETWIESILPLIDRQQKDQLTKIVDPSLLLDEDLLEEVWAVAIIAKMCLNPKPSRRPAIRHVLKALENPQRVVRDENFTASLRRSSRSSWNASLFGSWRHSSSETVAEHHHHSANSQGSIQETNQIQHTSQHHHRRPGSSEIFPEPLESSSFAFR